MCTLFFSFSLLKVDSSSNCAHLWPVVRVSAGVGPGVELAAVGGVEARHEAVVRQHGVEVLHTAAGVQLLQTLS